jgi:hypothetical protein
LQKTGKGRSNFRLSHQEILFGGDRTWRTGRNLKAGVLVGINKGKGILD